MKKDYIKPATTSFVLNTRNHLLGGSMQTNGNFNLSSVSDDDTSEGMTGWSREGGGLWDDEE